MMAWHTGNVAEVATSLPAGKARATDNDMDGRTDDDEDD